jgi:hypothetical protein
MKAVDHFYENTPENAPVPVFAAIIYVTRKASGATQSELDDYAADLRKINSAPATKQ